MPINKVENRELGEDALTTSSSEVLLWKSGLSIKPSHLSLDDPYISHLLPCSQECAQVTLIQRVVKMVHYGPRLALLCAISLLLVHIQAGHLARNRHYSTRRNAPHVESLESPTDAELAQAGLPDLRVQFFDILQWLGGWLSNASGDFGRHLFVTLKSPERRDASQNFTGDGSTFEARGDDCEASFVTHTVGAPLFFVPSASAPAQIVDNSTAAATPVFRAHSASQSHHQGSVPVTSITNRPTAVAMPTSITHSEETTRTTHITSTITVYETTYWTVTIQTPLQTPLPQRREAPLRLEAQPRARTVADGRLCSRSVLEALLLQCRDL